MATSPATALSQLYPFSTEDSKAIPLDIIRPLAMIKASLSSAGIATVTFPTTWKVASFYCPSGCFIEFNAATMPALPVSGTPYPNVLFVPPNCVVSSTVLPGVATITGLKAEASYLIAQQVQKWAGIGFDRQATRN